MRKKLHCFFLVLGILCSFSVLPLSSDEGTETDQKSNEEPSKFFDKIIDLMTSKTSYGARVYFPALDTDPNSGTTAGLMPVLIEYGEWQGKKYIHRLFAPSLTHNTEFGTTGTIRYYHYPEPDTLFFGFASKSQKENSRYTIRYQNPSFLSNWLFFRGDLTRREDGSLRFFGFGPDTQEEDESNYTMKEFNMDTTFGFNFLSHGRALLQNRVRWVRTNGGPLDNLPNIEDKFPNLVGIGKSRIVATRLRFAYDSRNDPTTTKRGIFFEPFAEFSSQRLGSDASFERYGADLRFFIPRGTRYVTAFRTLYDTLTENNTPFYEKAQVGGKEILRGFGTGRFAGRGRIVFNIEERIQLFSLEAFDARTEFMAVPFLEAGTVFSNTHSLKLNDFKPVAGIAFRAVVPPNIVGSLDIGANGEGVKIFIDIDHPF